MLRLTISGQLNVRPPNNRVPAIRFSRQTSSLYWPQCDHRSVYDGKFIIFDYFVSFSAHFGMIQIFLGDQNACIVDGITGGIAEFGFVSHRRGFAKFRVSSRLMAKLAFALVRIAFVLTCLSSTSRYSEFRLVCAFWTIEAD